MMNYQDALKRDEAKAFYERVPAAAEEYLAILRSDVSAWTELQFDIGLTFDKELLLERFLDRYNQWDHEELFDTIEAEIEGTWELCQQATSNSPAV